MGYSTMDWVLDTIMELLFLSTGVIKISVAVQGRSLLGQCPLEDIGFDEE